MSCETFTTEIKGAKYSYTQLSAKKSLKLKFRMAAVMGTAVSDILPAVEESEARQLKAFGAAIGDVFGNNDPDSMVQLFEDIMIPAFKDGDRINMDKHFTGKTLEMYEVLFWILKCEYGDFIAGINILD